MALRARKFPPKIRPHRGFEGKKYLAAADQRVGGSGDGAPIRWSQSGAPARAIFWESGRFTRNNNEL